MRVLVCLLFIGLTLAGCLAESPEGQATGASGGSLAQIDAAGNILHANIAAMIGEPIVMDHEVGDHNTAAVHQNSFNLEQLGWSALGVTIGNNGFANFVIHEDDDEILAFVAVDGDTEGGFAIADISDPANIELLGTYWSDGNSIQEVRVTPNGNYAVMNVQYLPGQRTPGQVSGSPGAEDCNVCIMVVDVRDRANPSLVSVFPVELLGTHNMEFEEYGNDLYLFYVGQPLYLPYPDPGNHVYITRFVEEPTGARIVPVGDFSYNPVQKNGRVFPHDVLVQDHPSGAKVAYVAAWDGGMVMFDVTDPLMPFQLGIEATQEPSGALSVHWAIQEERARAGGKVYAWSVPEIGTLLTDSGVARAYDVTDPTNPFQVGTWGLPGNVSIEGQYRMSPHTTAPNMDLGIVAVTHYHAGVWLLDATDPTSPQALAYYLPTGPEDAPIDGPHWWKKPNFNPEGFGPNTYQARWHDGVLWITDRGTGLYALDYTGPVPGAL